MSEYSNYLAHHGVKGQRWGVRRYQNKDGTLTEEGRKRWLELSKGVQDINESNVKDLNAMKEASKADKLESDNRTTAGIINVCRQYGFTDDQIRSVLTTSVETLQSEGKESELIAKYERRMQKYFNENANVTLKDTIGYGQQVSDEIGTNKWASKKYEKRRWREATKWKG